MPKQKDDSYSEQEMHDWLKSRGYDLGTGGKTRDTHAPADAVPPAATPTAPAAPGAAPGFIAPLEKTATELHHTFAGEGAPGRAPTYDEMDWQQRAGQGAAREMARLGIGAGRLAGRAFSPEWRNRLGDFAEQVPGVKRLEAFADAAAEGPMEYLGMGAADVATGGMIPSLGLGSKLGSLAARAPVWVKNPLTGTAQWMRGQGPVARTLAGAGTAAERAGTGAVGGAVMDPEDPVRGAEYGAGASMGTAAIGRALQSRLGQNLGGTLMRYLPASAAYALLHYLGHDILGAGAGGALGTHAAISHGLAHSIRGYHTPMGEYLHGVGKAATERTGAAIGKTLPAGIEAGKVAKEGYTPSDAGDAASDWWERTQRPTITVPRRPIYEDQGREEE